MGNKINKYLFIIYVIICNNLLATTINLDQNKPSIINQTIEKKLGQNIVNQLFKTNAILLDPLSREYIINLGTQLAKSSNHPPSNFSFFIMNDPQINAFALPGGFIGVNLGLINLTSSESELAGVLSHEIGHVTQNHIMRMFKKMDKLSLPMILGIIASTIAATQNPNVGYGSMMAILAGAQQSAINFTRSNEQEADRLALKLLYKAKFNPQALPSFFNKMHVAHQYNQSFFPDFLRTHPVNQQRISDLLGRVKQLPNKPYHENPNYLLIKERLNIFAQNTTESKLAYYEDLQKNTPTLFTNIKRYGYALELIRQNKFKQAHKQALILTKKNPEESFFIMLLAETYNYLNQPKESLMQLSSLYVFNPHSQPLSILYAELLLKNKKPKQATHILKNILYDKNIHPEVYKLLAKAAYMQKNLPYMHENQADYFLSMGQYQQAINQLKIALRLTKGNDYYNSLLKEKLNIVKKQKKFIESNQKK